MRISPKLKSFDQQLRRSCLVPDRGSNGVAASGIGENRPRIAAQLIGAKRIQFQVYPDGKRIIPRRDIDGALQITSLQGMVDAVSDVAPGGARSRHRGLWRLRLQGIQTR